MTEITEHSHGAREQNWVDQICYYRNLAIALGATEGDMLNKFDAGLCKGWSELSSESDSFQRAENQGIWDDNERLRSENEDLKQEIARHHKDFARWEAMADKGAQQIAENQALRERLANSDREFQKQKQRLIEYRDGCDQQAYKSGQLFNEVERLRQDNQKLIEALHCKCCCNDGKQMCDDCLFYAAQDGEPND